MKSRTRFNLALGLVGHAVLQGPLDGKGICVFLKKVLIRSSLRSWKLVEMPSVTET